MTDNESHLREKKITEFIPPFQIDELIEYLEKTSEKDWNVKTCASKDGKKKCVMAHIFHFGGGDGNIDEDGTNGGTRAWDFFEEAWATTYMIYPVNDGENPKYQQKTPKQRCIAYLKNLRDGKEKTTPDLFKETEEWLRKKYPVATERISRHIKK